jgi:pimeloyl-ACP methyl ester carboxylesterase
VTPAHETVASADGVPIRFEAAGGGEPTLLLVHGWALDRGLWRGELARLSLRQRVVALDLAGHGESGRQRSDWTMAAFGQDVAAVASAAGGGALVLVGHSMGGPVVLEAARRMPERVCGIVLVDTLLNVEEHMPGEQAEAVARQMESDYPAAATAMAGEYLFVPGTPEPVRERVLAGVKALPAAISLACLRAAWTYDPLPALREIRAPIRAVNSDHFPTALEVNRRRMPGFEAILVPGVGHYPMLEAPERFAEALDRALAGIVSAP